MITARIATGTTRSPSDGLHVAIASSGLGHVARGIESWAADLARALRERGTDVRLFKGGGTAAHDYESVVPCWQRSSRRAQLLHGCLPSHFVWRLGAGSTYGIEQLTFAWGLLQNLRRFPADILHVQDPWVAVYLQRAQQWGLIKTRTILGHGTEEPHDFLQRIQYLQHFCDWHLEEARRAGCWRPTWTAIPNFVDTERFSPGPAGSFRRELNIPEDALVVLAAAAIKTKHKRIDYLLGEVAGLVHRRSDLPLWLVVAGGRGEDTDALVQQGQQILGERVRFLVELPHERMPDLYRMANLFVLSSLKEMMPIALLEATASGLPCLVHHHPVLRWMIGPGGQASDISGEGHLAAALEALLDSPQRLTVLGGAAREHCLKHFCRNRVVSQILDYYRTILPPARKGLAGQTVARRASEGASGVGAGRRA